MPGRDSGGEQGTKTKQTRAITRPGNTPSTLFPPPPRSPRLPPIIRTSRTSVVSYHPCAPQILRTRSASCVDSPRCSCSCLSGIVFILTAQLPHSCLGTITTSVFRLSVQIHRVRRSTGRSDVQVHRVRRSTGRSGVQVNRVRRSTGRSGVQVHGVRRSRHVEGRNYAALLEIGASPRARCSLLPHSLFFRVCLLPYDVN